MPQSIQLPNTQNEGQAAVASFFTAAVLLTIPTGALPWAHFVVRHTGNAGKWYGSYAGHTPTTTTHDFVVGGGEPHQLDNPPKGAVTLLASADANGPLDWSLAYRA